MEDRVVKIWIIEIWKWVFSTSNNALIKHPGYVEEQIVQVKENGLQPGQP